MIEDLIDVLEQQLVEAAPVARRTVPARRRALHRRPQRAALIAVAALLALAGGATAGVYLIGASDRELPLRAERPQAQVASPRMQSQFGILSRPRAADDAMPEAAGAVLAKRPGDSDYDGANPALSHRAHLQVRRAGFWVVPGNDTICVVVGGASTAGGGCTTTRAALAGTFNRLTSGTELGTGRNEVIHYGLVPNGVTSVTIQTNLASLRVPVRDNMWAVAAKRGSVVGLTVGGRYVAIDSPPPVPRVSPPDAKLRTPSQR